MVEPIGGQPAIDASRALEYLEVGPRDTAPMSSGVTTLARQYPSRTPMTQTNFDDATTAREAPPSAKQASLDAPAFDGKRSGGRQQPAATHRDHAYDPVHRGYCIIGLRIQRAYARSANDPRSEAATAH